MYKRAYNYYLFIYLSVYSLFNNGSSNSDSIAWFDRKLVEYELERMWSGTAITYVKALFQNLAERAAE
jgi:hypothetical protein